MYHVYCLTNLLTDKKYIGFSSKIEHRLKHHEYGYNRTLIGKIISFYGAHNFKVELIDSTEFKDVALALERLYISKNETSNPEYGYNIVDGKSLLNKNVGSRGFPKGDVRNLAPPKFLAKFMS